MCSEVLSWREESWWERKSIPLVSHSFSPRQLFLLAIFGGVGDLISIPIPLTIFGIIYLGKLIPVFIMFAIGIVLCAQRIKMIPMEFQIFYRVSKKKDLTLGANLRRPMNMPSSQTTKSMEAQSEKS
jgi:hypothetical protein